MKIFLRLKHWQLFILLFGIPFLFQIVFMTIFFATVFSSQDPAASFPVVASGMLRFIPVLAAFFLVLYISWYYSLGVHLHKQLPSTVSMNLTRFRIFLFIPAIYILSFCIFMFVMISNFEMFNPFLFLIIFPLHLFSIFCIFYCLYFIAKTLKSIELQRTASFSDYIGEFFLL